MNARHWPGLPMGSPTQCLSVGSALRLVYTRASELIEPAGTPPPSQPASPWNVRTRAHAHAARTTQPVHVPWRGFTREQHERGRDRSAANTVRTSAASSAGALRLLGCLAAGACRRRWAKQVRERVAFREAGARQCGALRFDSIRTLTATARRMDARRTAARAGGAGGSAQERSAWTVPPWRTLTLAKHRFSPLSQQPACVRADASTLQCSALRLRRL